MDEYYMEWAISMANKAAQRGWRPFGNVIVDPEGGIIGAGGGSETDVDPTCHSEMVAIRCASLIRGGRLEGCTLYSTHEPCLMCTGAIFHSKVSRVVWGSFRSDLPTLFRPLSIGLARFGDTTHPPEIKGGVLRKQCIHLFNDELLLQDAGVLREDRVHPS